MDYIKVIIFLSIGLTFATTATHKNLNKRQSDIYLYDAYPIHYKVNVTVNINSSFTHAGIVDIDININLIPSSPFFSLAIKNLKINSVEVRRSTDWILFPSTYYVTNDILGIWFPNSMPSDRYILRIEFESTSTDNLFQSRLFHDPANESLIMTQSVQQFFPCWNNTELKATFGISVAHNDKYIALSNMNVLERYRDKNDDTKVWSTFYTTPRMAADELMIVLLPHITAHHSEFFNPTVESWCKSNATTTLSFAQDVINDVTAHLFRYTNETYPISKIDHVVIYDAPEFEYSNARWGIIIYRELDVIYDEKKHPTVQKLHMARKITSGVAHQWFGGLIAPKRAHSWLSKSFTKFFESYILNQVLEKWVEMFLLMQILPSTMYRDDNNDVVSQYSVPTILFELDKINDNTLIYVYHKGAFLLRMLQYVMGEETFRNGVLEFLRRNEHEFADTDDLWSAMQTALNAQTLKPIINIKTVMDTYTMQKSFPVVIVTRDYVTGNTIIWQQSYATFQPLHDVSKIGKINYDFSKWWIPVTWTTETDPNFNETIPTLWLKPDKNINIATNPDDWIIINLQQTGYYRVYYDRKNWKKIGNYLNNKDYTKIHVLNRAQLIHDICDMFKNGQTDWTLFAFITRYLSRETNYIPWIPMLLCFDTQEIRDFLSLPESKKFQLYFAGYFDGFFNEKGYEEDLKESNDDDLTKIARLNLAYKACNFGNPTCRNAARNKLEKYLANPTTYQILPWWEDWTFCFGLKTANIEIWNQVLQLYTERKEKIILKYLLCSENPNIITNFLNIILYNNTLVDNADVSYIIYKVIYQHLDDDLIFSYILNKFDSIDSIYKKNLLYDIIENLHHDSQFVKMFILIRNVTDMYLMYETKINQQWEDIRIIRNKFHSALQYNNLNDSSIQ